MDQSFKDYVNQWWSLNSVSQLVSGTLAKPDLHTFGITWIVFQLSSVVTFLGLATQEKALVLWQTGTFNVLEKSC